mgnify:CR=1 FL=1
MTAHLPRRLVLELHLISDAPLQLTGRLDPAALDLSEGERIHTAQPVRDRKSVV